MKVKKYLAMGILISVAIISVILDIVLKSGCGVFNEINRILFTLVTVIAGFWVTSYLLFLEIYKDRYPLKFIQHKYLPIMKYNITYVIYCIIFGCFIVIKNGGIVENFWYATSALFTVFIIIKDIYDASKNIMVNTYVDEFCEEISNKLNNEENSVKKGIFKDLRFVLDECVVKEEYYIAQNIAIKLGDVFREFLRNSIKLVENGEKCEVEDSFDRIINLGAYQLELCEDINSDLLVNEIVLQQINNIEFCIEAEQYEWFKKYIKKLTIVTFQEQKDGHDKVASEIFDLYTRILEKLVRDSHKEEWTKYMMDKLFTITTSLNFLSSNINLKYFVSLVTYGLLKCEEGKTYDYLYELFDKITSVTSRVSNGFSDTKIYYAIFFNNVKGREDVSEIKKFFDTIFKYTQELGNATSWMEFKFYCVQEVLDKKINKKEFDIDEYHINLLIEVIEMKEQYNGYMVLPKFREKFKEVQYSKDECDKICDDIRYLLNKCIINDNLNLFFIFLKKLNECIVNTESRNKDQQISLFDLFIWLVERTKRLNNKQFLEIVFNEIEDVINELDKNRAISKDFGDTIVSELTDIARQADSDSYNVVLQVVELFSNFLKENKELYFISNYPERKEKLYRSIYNIATSCIENDFEEGVRRCSNTMGWFIIYSIKQGNGRLTKYLIDLAKEMLDISIDMGVSTKTKTFLLTLFTTVGMFCCKQSINYIYIESILCAIEKVESKFVYTALKIRTYENDMWDGLLDGSTQPLASTFKKKYEDHKKKIS